MSLLCIQNSDDEEVSDIENEESIEKAARNQFKDEDEEAAYQEAGMLTAEERDEIVRLQNEGFKNWKHDHLKAYVKACERYGRDDIESIVRSKIDSLSEKSEQEIRAYHYAFWRHYNEDSVNFLKNSDGPKWIKMIEKGEAKLAKQKATQDLIDGKLKSTKGDPLENLQIPYPKAGTQKTFNEEEDRFILATLSRIGFGEWEQLRNEILNSYLFKFNWYFKSRTPNELKTRTEYLVSLLQKDGTKGQSTMKSNSNKTKLSQNQQNEIIVFNSDSAQSASKKSGAKRKAPASANDTASANSKKRTKA